MLCPECGKYLARGSLVAHHQNQNGMTKGGLGQKGDKEGRGYDTRNFQVKLINSKLDRRMYYRDIQKYILIIPYSMYCHTKWECDAGIISYLLHHSVVRLDCITDTNNAVQRMGQSTFIPQKFDNHTKLI